MVKLTAFASGAAILILELLGVRLLTPTFGSSILVWSAVIAVFLGAMAMGYSIGGKLGDRFPDRRLLSAVLVVSAVLIAFAAFIAYPTASFIGRANFPWLWGPTLGALAIFGLPSAVLAFVPPIVIRLEMRAIERAGAVSGRVFAVSTLGSIVGTLAVPSLIAALPIRVSLYLLSGALVFLALLLASPIGKRS